MYPVYGGASQRRSTVAAGRPVVSRRHASPPGSRRAECARGPCRCPTTGTLRSRASKHSALRPPRDPGAPRMETPFRLRRRVPATRSARRAPSRPWTGSAGQRAKAPGSAASWSCAAGAGRVDCMRWERCTLNLRTGGRPLPANDVWIAASAARAGATLPTFDAHFRSVARVGTLVLRTPVLRYRLMAA